MKRLLRSVIDFEDGKISSDALNVNFQRLNNSNIEWMYPVDDKIYKYVRAFFQNNFGLPTAVTVRDFFTRENDQEVLERMNDIQASATYVRLQYAHLLSQLLEDQNRLQMRALLKEAEEIVSKGHIVQEGREKVKLHGVKDAMMYFNRRANDLIPADSNTKLRGDLREDTERAWQEYQIAKRDKGKVWGCFTGLNEIDKVCHGCKRGEMWVHAAFVGELKTTFALNWCYNLVTRYRTNVFYASIEMPYDQIRRNIYAIHSANSKWKVLGRKPLSYAKIRDGELNEEEEAFYQEILADFNENPNYCRFEVWQPGREITMADIRVEAELMHKQMDVGFIVIDHGSRVQPKIQHKDYTIALNTVLSDAKLLAMHFNGGEGVPLLMLFQLSRQGKDEADKSDGKYKLKALSYANEAERSADYVTTTYLNDQHRAEGTTIFCNLKNRDNQPFEPFTASITFDCRRISNRDPTVNTPSGMRVDTPGGLDEVSQAMMNIQ